MSGLRDRQHQKNMASITGKRDTSLTDGEQKRVRTRLRNRGQVDELSQLNPGLMALAGKAPAPKLSASGGTSLEDALKARREKWGAPSIAGHPTSRVRTKGGEPIPLDEQGHPLVSPGRSTAYMRETGTFETGDDLRKALRGKRADRAKNKGENRVALRELRDASEGKRAEEERFNAVLKQAAEADRRSGGRTNFFAQVSANIAGERERKMREALGAKAAANKQQQQQIDIIEARQKRLHEIAMQGGATPEMLEQIAEYDAAIGQIGGLLPAASRPAPPTFDEQAELDAENNIKDAASKAGTPSQRAAALIRAEQSGALTPEAIKAELARHGAETQAAYEQQKREAAKGEAMWEAWNQGAPMGMGGN
jgi:hypothetical protein